MLSISVANSLDRVFPSLPYVLLVDDHQPSLRRLHEVVKLEGHPCVPASSAIDALRMMESRRPQVVVTDLDMPNLDGYGLARWVKGRHPSVPIVLVTGDPLDTKTLIELRRTFIAVYTKPLDVAAFLDRLNRLMPAT